MILTTGFTNCSHDAGKFFNRPKIREGISLGDGYSAYNGEEVSNYKHITIYPEDYLEGKDYCSDKEYRLYICLKYPKRCK
jgi:hypothetical protein